MSDRNCEDIKDLRDKNEEQNKRITTIETDVNSIMITLIGVDGKNGMRKSIEDIRADIKKLTEQPWKIFNRVLIAIGGIGTVVGIIVAVVKLVP